MKARSRQPSRDPLLSMAMGAALLSMAGIFVEWAGVPPTVSAFYRMLFGGVLLLVLITIMRTRQPFAAREWALALFPAVAFAADLALWHRSVVYIGPGLATLLANFQVFVMAVCGAVIYRERLGAGFAVGLVAALAGLWLLVGAHWNLFDEQHRIGVWLGLATALAYAAYLLAMRRTQSGPSHLSPEQFLAITCLECAVLLGLLALWQGEPLQIPSLRSLAVLLALALSVQVIAWRLIVRAMPHLPASIIGLLLLLQPTLAFVLDVLLFSRRTDVLDWTGLGLALAGIFLGARRSAAMADRHAG